MKLIKSILALAAAVFIGTSAQAAEYTLTYELQNIPKQVEGHPDHDFIYLADTNGNVYCYVDRKVDMTKDGDNWKLASTTVAHAAGSTAYTALAGKTVVAHTLTAATIVKSGNGAVFSLTFTTETNLNTDAHVEWNDATAGSTKDLVAVVTNSDGDEGCEEYKAVAKPGATRTGETATGYTISASAAYPVLKLEAFEAVKVYDGLPTNATYTVDQGDATVTVAYSEDYGESWTDEAALDPAKFTNLTDLYARFYATKKGWCQAYSEMVPVRITPRPVTVTAPNLTFTLDAEDDAIDAEIESKIDIEKAGEFERGLLEGDEITYKWAREEASYKDRNREEDVSYEITFPDEGEYEDYNVNYQGNYIVNYVGGTLKFPKPPAIDLMVGDTAPVITTTETALKWWVEKNDAADKYLTVTVERLVDATAKLTITAKGTDEAAEPAVIKLFGDNKLVKTITVNVLAKEDYDRVDDLAMSIMIDETWSYTTVATSDTDNWSITYDPENYSGGSGIYKLDKMDGYFTNNAKGTDATSRKLTRNEDGTVTLSITGVAPNGTKPLILDLKRGNEVVQKFQVWVVEAVQDVQILKGDTVRKTGSYNGSGTSRRWVTDRAFRNSSDQGIVGLSLKNGNNEFQQQNFQYTETYPDYKYNTTTWNASFNADLKGNEVGSDVVRIARFEPGNKTSFSPCFRYNVYVYETKMDSVELKAGGSTNLTCTSEVAGAWEATSSDPTIATVTEAGWSTTEFKPTIMALKKGEATLTIKNIYCTYTVTVKVTQGLETENVSIEAGESIERTIEGGATVESSDDSIATIALAEENTKAVITGVSAGDATCTVKDESGNEIYQYIVKVSETKIDELTVMLKEYKDYPCTSVKAAAWKAESSDPDVVKVVNDTGAESTEFELKLLGVAEGSATVTVQNDYVKYTINVNVKDLIPVAVPTAENLTYNGNEQTGVVENVGFTLTGNAATDADSYTATATLADGYIWADGSSDPTNINWSIGYAQVTVKADDADKLVGSGDDPDFEVTVRGLFGGDEIDYEVARTNKSEEVGTYDLVVTGAARQGNYDVVCVNGTFKIRAGKITVNGKGYDDISEALADLKQNGGSAVCNDDIDWDAKDTKFSKGTVLEYDNREYIFTVTGNMTVPGVTSEETIVVKGTLTLNGDLYVDDDWGGANVDATNVVLGDDVTVGETEGEETDEIAVLAFDEIDVGDYKLTLTVNGTVQSAKALEIDAVFAEAPEGFQIVETPIDGGFKYTLEEQTDITIQIKVDEDEGNIEAVSYDDVDYANKDLELPAETKEVTLTLEAGVSLNVPVYKVVRDNVTNVTTKVATYAIADGDTLEFFAMEADDSDATDEQIKAALLDWVDDDEEAAEKINKIVGSGAKQVSAKDLATYIDKHTVLPSYIVESEYVAASVKLNTNKLITDEWKIKFDKAATETSDGFIFDFELFDDGDESADFDKDNIAVYIQATEDIATAFVSIDEDRVSITDKNEVLIEPEEGVTTEFFKIALPPDSSVSPD